MPKKKTDEESPSAPKLFDVAKPGKTAATATSRPVIVGHGSTLKKDPMVNSSEDEKEDTEKVPVRSHGPVTIQPLNEITGQDDESKTEEPNDSDISDTKAPPENSDAAAVDALANEANDKKEAQKENDEAAKRALELEKIIESKQYFVPVGEAKRRRSNQRILMVILLLLVLSISGINFAADAGMLSIGVDPLTDIL